MQLPHLTCPVRPLDLLPPPRVIGRYLPKEGIGGGDEQGAERPADEVRVRADQGPEVRPAPDQVDGVRVAAGQHGHPGFMGGRLCNVVNGYFLAWPSGTFNSK